MQIQKFKIQRHNWGPRCDLYIFSIIYIVYIVQDLYAILLWLVSESIFKVETPNTSDHRKQLNLKTR